MATARLPISENLEMSGRTVLTTNHVVEIMLRWIESGDWGEAFMKVVPVRKGVRLKNGGYLAGDDGGREAEAGREDQEVEENGGGEIKTELDREDNEGGGRSWDDLMGIDPEEATRSHWGIPDAELDQEEHGMQIAPKIEDNVSTPMD